MKSKVWLVDIHNDRSRTDYAETADDCFNVRPDGTNQMYVIAKDRRQALSIGRSRVARQMKAYGVKR